MRGWGITNFLLVYSTIMDEETWEFGLADTSQKPAVGCMELVPRRDAATLLPIISSMYCWERPYGQTSVQLTIE